MKHKIIAPLLLLVLLTALTYSGCSRQSVESYAQIEGNTLPLETTELIIHGSQLPNREDLLQLTQLQTLDIRNVPVTISEYEALQQDFLDTTILWLVPFQDTHLPTDTEKISICSLSVSDFVSFRYLPHLKEIDATNCTDYDALFHLKEEYPDFTVRYNVFLNGNDYPDDASHIQLQDANIAELSKVLPYLLEIREIHFLGTVPEYADIHSLADQYPLINFVYDLDICGVTVSNTTETLDLSGISITNTDEIEEKIHFFPNLQKIDMCDCGIATEQMAELANRHPDIRFIWKIKIRDQYLRTDSISFIPYKLGYDLDKPLHDADLKELKYCIDLICLDLGHMKIRDVSFLEHMPNMQYLVLVDMPCKDFSALANLKELIYLELFNVQFTQHEVLLGMEKLEDLNISSTPTRDIDVLKQMTWLKRLWITRTRLSAAQIEELQDCLPNTQVESMAPHSTANGWRDNDNYRKMRDLLGMFYMN